MKKMILLVSFLFLATSLIFAQTADMKDETKKLYNDALKAQKAGDFAGAIKKFDEALKIEQNSELFFRKGLAERNANKLDDAIKSFQQAITKNANNDQAHFYLGSVLFSQKNFNDAVVAFEKAKSVTKSAKVKELAESNITKCKEQFAYPLVLEATKALNSRDYKKAIQLYTEANSVFERADAYAGISNAYYELGEYDKGIEAGNKSLSIEKSKNPAANFYVGLNYKMKKDNEKAKQYLTLAMADRNFKERAKFEIDSIK